MLRSILAYNFTPERLQMLKMVALLCKAQVKAVAREDMLQPVGYLAGIKGIAPVEEKYSGGEATEEMIFLCGFDRPTLDKLLVESNWQDYAINVHGMKSNLFNIGADAVAEKCYELEMASKSADDPEKVEFIRQNHHSVMKMYAEVAEEAKKYI